MKKILKILFAFLAPALLAFSCAHAEEVDLVPDDYSILYLQKPDNSLLVQEIKRTVDSSSFPSNNVLGPYTLVNPSYYLYSSNAGSGYLDSVKTVWGSSGSAQDFSVKYTNCEIGLDMSENINGYYRYGADLYFGLGGGFTQYANTNAIMDLTPSYTYNSAPFAIGDSEDGMHCMVYLVGETEYTHHSNAGSNELETFSLVHIYIESTFYYDSSYGTDIVFQIGSWFDNNISSLNFDLTDFRANGTSKNFDFYANNRFHSTLVGNVEPPVTPTPTPTPSPNQDIINNDNSNTTNIITTINDGFDALSAVFQGSIYGLTDLIFGSASDWIDFFSDVQDDMEEYLPVVTFFQSCKNILANFFNVESTDPTALQYIAGWQSDIYTLHINALPLVLPEGTFNFFPEVNFNLNNPFMNEIRPYWLTFSNVLITLLFLRYLANYLFRWTQLLTGDTSVAFQLFHHAPDELENLGTDPYDLAGDYSYDSIDSANHDLYQDAEAHYGHGAARYLSKVFHIK